MSFAGFTSPPMGTGAAGSARREVLMAETGAERLLEGLTSSAGSASPGAEAALPPFNFGVASRTSPREDFFDWSTAGVALATTGAEAGFEFREAEIGAGIGVDVNEEAAEFALREAGAAGAGCSMGVEVKFEL